jgi:CheY-like chemotaxis protein
MAHILVADDNEFIRASLVCILEQKGHQVTATANGEQCLQVLLRSEDVAMVITDIRMPGMDGITLTRTIRLHAISVPVVVVTGETYLAGRPVAQAAVDAGAQSLLRKPFSSEVLHSIMDRLLAA